MDNRNMVMHSLIWATALVCIIIALATCTALSVEACARINAEYQGGLNDCVKD